MATHTGTEAPAPAGVEATPDALQTIKQDHDVIRKLFAGYKASTDSDAKLSLAREIVTTVSRHASAEERTLYPLIKEHVPGEKGGKMLYDMMCMDDQVNKEVLNYLDTHQPGNSLEWDLFDHTMAKFMCIEEDHMSTEEKTVLAELAMMLSGDQNRDLYHKWSKALENAPLHPHPMGGTTYLPAKIMHPVAGVMDKVGHAVTGMVNMVLGEQPGKTTTTKEPEHTLQQGVPHSQGAPHSHAL